MIYCIEGNYTLTQATNIVESGIKYRNPNSQKHFGVQCIF